MRLLWRTENGRTYPLLRAEIVLKTGSDPKCGWAEILSDEAPPQTGTILFRPENSSEGTAFDLPQLRLSELTRLEGEPSLWRARLVDARASLQNHTNVAFNIPTNSGCYDPLTLKGGRLWRWRDVLQYLLDEAGFSVTNISELPQDPVPLVGVEWRGIPVGKALDWLLGVAGYILCREPNGFSIRRVGQGQTGVCDLEVVERQSVERDSGFCGVEVVCGNLTYWTEVELEPAAIDEDGSIKPLTKIGYLSGVDLPHALASGFHLLDEPLRRLAAASVGHLFLVPHRLKHLLPLKHHDPDGKTALLISTLIDRSKDGPLTTLPEGPIPGWTIIDPHRGIVYSPHLLGRLTVEKTEVLPRVLDGEEVGIEVAHPRLVFPAITKSETQPLRYKVRRGKPPYLTVQLGFPDVTSGGASQAYAERIATNLADALLNLLQTSGEVVTYAGAAPVCTSGVIGQVRYRFDGAAILTEVSPLNPSLWNSKTFCRGINSGDGAGGFSGGGISLNLVNAPRAGAFPLVAEQEKEKGETKLAGRLKRLTDNGSADIDHIAPFEKRNFKFRQHTESDAVWALRMISDDRHAQDTQLNRATPVLRLCDDAEGDLADIWRVRAIPSAEAVSAGKGGGFTTAAVSNLKSYRTMWLINTETAGEGGWLTDVPPEGLGLRRKVEELKKPAPPRHIAQIGDIIILTDDDTICLTSDGDLFTRANIRHDAHFHLDRDHDGRIHFTDASAGTRPSGGWDVIGEMVCDPALANQNSALQKESGQWCPQIKINTAVQPAYPLGTDMQVTEHPDVTLPLDPITNTALAEASLAEGMRDTINAVNRLTELLNGIFTPDLGE